MSSPTRPVPVRQLQAFHLALCERLGLDPVNVISDDFRASWEVTGGDEFGKVSVSFTAILPADEILAMFNGAATDRGGEDRG